MGYTLYLSFVKYDLKIWILTDHGRCLRNAPAQTVAGTLITNVTDIAAKSNFTVEVLCKTSEFKISVFGPFCRHSVRCYDKRLSLRMHFNST
jgi:hypothetical protein